MMDDDLLETPLNALHAELGARMVPFAGYAMPVQYPMGVLHEHLWTRARAGLFDVSHMGQVLLRPRSGNIVEAACALEALVPVDLAGLTTGRQRYALFTNAAGGIEDDLMVSRRSADLFLVVNAACKGADIAYMQQALSTACEVLPLPERALLALQGPAGVTVLEALVPGVAAMRFMDVGVFESDFGALWISRSGYTGEDGFEISVPDAAAERLARALLAHDDVAPIGLGARDSLRLEAGLCLYGADIDATTSPVEAALGWALQKVRRPGGARAGGYPGADRIARELAEGPARRRVGLLPEGRAPMRAGTALFAADAGGEPIGHVTSGGFGPSLNRPVAMGYVAAAHAAAGTALWGEVRGKRLPVAIVPMPFQPTTYKR